MKKSLFGLILDNHKNQKTMRKRFIFTMTMVYIMFGSKLNAQEAQKWEVGTDLLWLINKNSLPAYSALVKRKIGQHYALRMRIGLEKESSSSPYTNVRAYDINDRRNFIVNGGIERRKSLIDDELYLFYGLDVGFGVSKNFIVTPFIRGIPQVNLPPNIPYSTIYLVESDANEYGGVILGGLRYFFNEHLSVSLESHLNYTNQKVNIPRGYQFEGDNGVIMTHYNRKSVTFKPLAILNFSVHF